VPAGATVPWKSPAVRSAVRTYLLGTLEFDETLAFQRRLADEVAEGGTPALICCEHPPLVTVGRSGSHAHMDLDLTNRAHRAWPVRWVNRGGGCWFHSPGQMALYPVLPLQRLGLGVREYVNRLQLCILEVVRELGVPGGASGPDVLVGMRPVACIGAAVRDWTTYFGAILNVNPDLYHHRLVRAGPRHLPMTSLQRECRRPFRIGHVRERLVEHFIARFQFADTLFFSGHPSLGRRARIDALTAAR
jgi:lipoyl(octanoyl) transferase